MLAFYKQLQDDGKIYRLLSSSRAGQFLTKRLIELFAKKIKSQIEDGFPAEQLLAPIEIIALSYRQCSNWIGELVD